MLLADMVSYYFVTPTQMPLDILTPRTLRLIPYEPRWLLQFTLWNSTINNSLICF